jgi:hypothetical protein
VLKSLLIANRGEIACRIIRTARAMKMLRFPGPFLIAVSLTAPAIAAPTSQCLKLIREWRDATDCQISEAIPKLTWPDGYTKWPGLQRTKWSDINLTGPCPKYSTTLREIRVLPIVKQRQITKLKAITRSVKMDGRFTGEYQVTKETYTCERRSREWRLFSKVVIERTYHQNKKFMRRMESTQ